MEILFSIFFRVKYLFMWISKSTFSPIQNWLFWKTVIVFVDEQPCSSCHLLLLFLPNSDLFGKSTNELLFAPPVLLFLFTIDCPKMTKFWVLCVSWYVGFSFWRLAPRSCEKWFSTKSWLTMAGFITDPGNRDSFSLITEVKPRIIDWMPNHSLADTNSLPVVLCRFHSVNKINELFNARIRLLFTW